MKIEWSRALKNYLWSGSGTIILASTAIIFRHVSPGGSFFGTFFANKESGRDYSIRKDFIESGVEK